MMKIYIRVLFVLLAFAFSYKNCLPQATVDWYRIYGGPRNIAFDSEQIAVDDSGYIYMTGTDVSGPYGDKTSYLDIVTVKYSPDGNLLWERTYFNSGNREDFAKSLTLDRYNNVYVTGNITDTVSNAPAHVTLKYNSNGDLMWAAKQKYADNYFPYRKGLLLDSDLNVYVFCRDNNYSYLIKYNSAGDSLWKYKTPDEIKGSMLDNNNNLILADVYGIRKLSNSGNLVWRKVFQDTLFYADLTADSYGNYYLCGEKRDSLILLKLNSNGDITWKRKMRKYSITYYNFYGTQRMLMAKDGNIVVASQTPRGNFGELFINKYNTDGDSIWSIRYFLSDSSYQILQELKEDSRGFLYAYGLSSKATYPYIPKDYMVIMKIEPDGRIVRTTRFGTLPTYDGYPKSFTIDKNFKMYVGLSDYINQSYFYNQTILVKYSQPYDTLFIPATVPVGYELLQNYPNPFNVTTNFKFRLAKYTHVKLSVYDVLGRKVADLIDENVQADWHTYTWDASGFSSGLYFYKFETPEYSAVRKMMLVK